MADGDSLYPFEVVVRGTPISLQASGRRSLVRWKQVVADASRLRQRETYELGFLDNRPLSVCIYYFPAAEMTGDIDNIVKPIMDAMVGVAYLDDQVVERVTVQKFEPEVGWYFMQPSARLAAALEMRPPIVYLRVDDDTSWRTV